VLQLQCGRIDHLKIATSSKYLPLQLIRPLNFPNSYVTAPLQSQEQSKVPFFSLVQRILSSS
jgi:hypothetical protein